MSSLDGNFSSQEGGSSEGSFLEGAGIVLIIVLAKRGRGAGQTYPPAVGPTATKTSIVPAKLGGNGKSLHSRSRSAEQKGGFSQGGVS